jgi:hypothetical protein
MGGMKRGTRALGDRLGRTRTMNKERKVIELEQGWAFMQTGITKLKNLLEGVPEQQFNSEEYIRLYEYYCFSLSLSLFSLPRRQLSVSYSVLFGGQAPVTLTLLPGGAFLHSHAKAMTD